MKLLAIPREAIGTITIRSMQDRGNSRDGKPYRAPHMPVYGTSLSHNAMCSRNLVWTSSCNGHVRCALQNHGNNLLLQPLENILKQDFTFTQPDSYFVTENHCGSIPVGIKCSSRPRNRMREPGQRGSKLSDQFVPPPTLTPSECAGGRTI